VTEPPYNSARSLTIATEAGSADALVGPHSSLQHLRAHRRIETRPIVIDADEESGIVNG
jgi:hypothetical protein